ncbi:MAG: hypothetical protein HY868_25595 [Chloroflexi bacterium]|nr:hypothetical protein [Chloroflexota bacterium]
MAIPVNSDLTAKNITVTRATDAASTEVVHGGDTRLAQATTTQRGTVELATNGETAANVAVQGNDYRLTGATISAYLFLR